MSETPWQLGGEQVSPSVIVCVGLNYRDHAEEVGLELPHAPLLFAKLPSAICYNEQAIEIPPGVHQVDYEAELGVVIGQDVRDVSPSDAMDAVAGYACVNDVSARDLQFADVQWTRGKSVDSFCPIGPFVPKSEVPDPHSLAIECRVNGTVVQESNTSQMIFKVPELISYISRTVTLRRGDLIATGTPAGVGMSRVPQLFLVPGDVVEIRIERVGMLRNRVASRTTTTTVAGTREPRATQ